MLYPLLPGFLDSNPFSESGQLQVPEDVRRVLDICTQTLQLLRGFQVHPEILTQLFAYLFFFINALLFNLLMERGESRHVQQRLCCLHICSCDSCSCVKGRAGRFTTGPVGSRSGLTWICWWTGLTELDSGIWLTLTFSSSPQLSIYWPRRRRTCCRSFQWFYSCRKYNENRWKCGCIERKEASFHWFLMISILSIPVLLQMRSCLIVIFLAIRH